MAAVVGVIVGPSSAARAGVGLVQVTDTGDRPADRLRSEAAETPIAGLRVHRHDGPRGVGEPLPERYPLTSVLSRGVGLSCG